jgi:hypothetical protein
VESAAIAHNFFMDDSTVPTEFKPQQRHVRGESPSDSLETPRDLVEGNSQENLPPESPKTDKPAPSGVRRPAAGPKKFSALLTATEVDRSPSLGGDVRADSKSKGRGRSNSKKPPKNALKFPNFKGNISLRAALVWGLVLACVVGLSFFKLGTSAARNSKNLEKPKDFSEITPEIHGVINEIIKDLQDRKGQVALEKIGQLRTLAPDFSFASILAANAALIEKDLQTAEDESEASLAGRVAEPDAFMVQALVVMSRLKEKGYKSMGNPKAHIETLLHKAIAADPLEPDSYILMAAVKRAARESREALDFLQSSRLRQSAASDTMVTEAAINLLELEMMLDADLPPLSDQNEAGILNQFSTAYTAMRLGNREVAVSNLTRAKESLPPKVFAQILADPAFSTYSQNPQFAEIFKKQ